jgi:hypothetical protein
VHRLNSAFVLGYHGCDAAIAERVLAGEAFTPSTNEYDWLGHGIYFWEANPKRGLEFAKILSKRPRGSSRIDTPCVIGAVIDWGLCLDLTTTAGIDRVRVAYGFLKFVVENAKPARNLPENHPDGLRRNLDCAVINILHTLQNEAAKAPFDTVKGLFIEGEPVYPGSAFQERTHSQICVRNPDCIKGVFRVPEIHLA